jgi:hypothetical protein
MDIEKLPTSNEPHADEPAPEDQAANDTVSNFGTPPVDTPATPLPPMPEIPTPSEPWTPPTAVSSDTFSPQPSFSAPTPDVPQVSDNVINPDKLVPQAVVKVLSPRGLEYAFMTIALFTAAFALSAALISLVNGQTSFAVLSFPVACLITALPVFAALFLRLKTAEQRDPQLRFDPSKRRATQFTQIVSFVVGFFTLIGFVTTVFAKLSGQYDGSIVKIFLDVLVIEAVAGGLLAYYWNDEHRSK